MQNTEEVHVTGTGTIQEQFIHYLADTAQFKNTAARECTSNKNRIWQPDIVAITSSINTVW